MTSKLQSTRTSRVLQGLVGETRLLADSLSCCTADSDSISQSLAVLYLVSQGTVEAREAAALIESVSSGCGSAAAKQNGSFDQICSAAARFFERLSTFSLDEFYEQLAARMGDAAPYCVEPFLAAYDRQERRARGVFFTPLPIVNFIVRAAVQLLREQVGVKEGLAAGKCTSSEIPVRIVDPACGTGIFLRQALEYSSASRLAGFEVLLPNAVAAKYLMSYRTPAARIIATSALTAASDELLDHDGTGPLVVLGNPPYSNFGRRNRDPWMQELLRPYCEELGERKHNLNDDFVKFIRWAEYQIERAGSGVLALITNSAYTMGITHRLMRRSLLGTFDQIYILDCGGRLTNDRSSDENVFGIRTAVAITLMVRRPSSDGDRRTSVFHASLEGSRSEKLAEMDCMTPEMVRWSQVSPSAPMYWFVSNRTSRPPAPYHDWPALEEIFEQFISGVQSKNDELLVDFDRQALADRMEAYIRMTPAGARHEIHFDPLSIRPYMVAPLDTRWIYYDPKVIGRARYQVMRHMLSENLGLVFMRQSTNDGAYDHFLAVSDLVSDRVFYSVHGAPYLAPLWLYDGSDRRPNLRASFLKQLADCTKTQIGALEAFAYIYGAIHQQAYRDRWRESLKCDFPRIPLPTSNEIFRHFVDCGNTLIQLHAGCKAREPEQLRSDQSVDTHWLVAAGYPKFMVDSSARGRLMINNSCGLDDVPLRAWEARIGGYAVLQRWIKQRRARCLGGTEREYLLKLIRVLDQTAAVMEGDSVNNQVAS